MQTARFSFFVFFYHTYIQRLISLGRVVSQVSSREKRQRMINNTEFTLKQFKQKKKEWKQKNK
jgi:hypothetical protein